MEPLSLGIGLVSGVSSLIGDIFEQDAAKKAKENALNAYKKLLIPFSETQSRSDTAGDTLYTKAMSELNSGAFAARGALNPETLKTIAYTKMAGSRAETEFQVQEEDLKYNRGIQQQIAQIGAQPVPTINPLNAIEAGVSGYFAGKQLDMAQELTDAQKRLMNAQTDYYKQEPKNNYFDFTPEEQRRYDQAKIDKNMKNFFSIPLELPKVSIDPNEVPDYVPPVTRKKIKKEKSTLSLNFLTPTFKGFNF